MSRCRTSRAVVCAPAEPNLDTKAFEALINATKTQPPEWGYPIKDGVEVRSAGKPDAPVIEKLGITLVRVLADNIPPEDPNKEAFLHIATPSGKSGYVPLEAMSSLGTDQLCYSKEGGAGKLPAFSAAPPNSRDRWRRNWLLKRRAFLTRIVS